MADLNYHNHLANSTNLSGHFLGKSRVGTYEYAAYIGENNINVRRYVQEGDGFVHVPHILDGYVVNIVICCNKIVYLECCIIA